MLEVSCDWHLANLGLLKYLSPFFFPFFFSLVDFHPRSSLLRHGKMTVGSFPTLQQVGRRNAD